MSQAVANGAKVVVCAGYLQEAAIRRAAIEFPDVNFIFIDGYSLTEDPDNPDAAVLTNVAGVNFNEEQCGYLAGYACRQGRLHPAGLLRRRRRHERGLLPLRLRLPAGRFRRCRGARR